ncbi:hypothetical protein OG562_37105 [Streptomyces sp. NBC_01275]|uniref:hypothetical protein n=1 Tax=Streptomyces sp. NBC_01275 TaxID=2903807 RepID=UPI0022501CBA|nr:hypothetical protein [Streptomyces sp. NBC_01275]MCX4766496.1 hypothetical protein [Streptomyces sp. NBC_01275]
MQDEKQPDATSDGSEALRKARFGALPERILLEDMVEEQPPQPRDPSRDAFDPDEVSVRNAL